jgi:hypothetical protein
MNRSGSRTRKGDDRHRADLLHRGAGDLIPADRAHGKHAVPDPRIIDDYALGFLAECPELEEGGAAAERHQGPADPGRELED